MCIAPENHQLQGRILPWKKHAMLYGFNAYQANPQLFACTCSSLDSLPCVGVLKGIFIFNTFIRRCAVIHRLLYYAFARSHNRRSLLPLHLHDGRTWPLITEPLLLTFTLPRTLAHSQTHVDRSSPTWPPEATACVRRTATQGWL